MSVVCLLNGNSVDCGHLFYILALKILDILRCYVRLLISEIIGYYNKTLTFLVIMCKNSAEWKLREP